MSSDESTTGLRYNEGKVRMDLLPWDALEALAEHYTRGAAKYADRNWEKGMKWNKGCAGSLVRHLGKWSLGEDKDAEGFYHDVAMAWNALALVTYRLREIGEDDRHKIVVGHDPCCEGGGKNTVVPTATAPAT